MGRNKWGQGLGGDDMAGGWGGRRRAKGITS